MSLMVADSSGYCQRALYHEMKLYLVHMNVLAGTGGGGKSKPPDQPVAPCNVAHGGAKGLPLAGSSLAPGRGLGRARLTLCAYT